MRLKHLLHYSLLSGAILSAIFLVGILGHFFLFEPTEVNGRSMEPTYFDADEIYIEKLSLLFSTPKRGMIVSAIDDETDTLLIKRVIGLPGEQVHIKKGRITIIHPDGTETELEEPYLSYGTITLPISEKEFLYPVIPENHYFIVGDNRTRSTDSRAYGAVHRDTLIGRVRNFPWSN